MSKPLNGPAADEEKRFRVSRSDELLEIYPLHSDLV